MFNNTTIQACARSLVGIRQSANPCYEVLCDYLKTSTSGLYVNDLPSVNFDIIENTIIDDYTDVNEYLDNVFTSEVEKIIFKFVNNNKTKLGSKELLSNFPFVSGVADFTQKQTQNARFVGYLIRPIESNNLVAEITHIGMQIDTLQTTPVKIYLYESSQREPIATYDYTNTKTYSLEWFEISNFICNYQSNSGGTGQQFLLGYYEQDPVNLQSFQLQGQALRMTFDCGCSTAAKRKYQNFINIDTVEINNQYLNYSGCDYYLPDNENFENFITNETYGLVAKMNIRCDITPVICSNISIFAEVLQYSIAKRILWDAFSSTKLNNIADSKNIKEQCKQFALKYEAYIDGYTDESGIKHKGIMDNITIDFSNIDSICLPCKQEQPFIGRVFRRR